jgi:hypothetical protein
MHFHDMVAACARLGGVLDGEKDGERRRRWYGGWKMSSKVQSCMSSDAIPQSISTEENWHVGCGNRCRVDTRDARARDPKWQGWGCREGAMGSR